MEELHIQKSPYLPNDTLIDPSLRVVYIFGLGVLDFKLPPSQLLIGRKSASNWLEKNLRAVSYGRIHVCWNYKVIRSQRRCLEGLFDDRDDADDEY